MLILHESARSASRSKACVECCCEHVHWDCGFTKFLLRSGSTWPTPQWLGCYLLNLRADTMTTAGSPSSELEAPADPAAMNFVYRYTSERVAFLGSAGAGSGMWSWRKPS